jgi:single-strand DNA-binding protein
MMTTIRNHVTLIGNIGTTTEVTNFENGSKVARFSVSTDRVFRANSGKMHVNKEWHRIFAWGNMAQFIENYAEKGKKVAIHGRLVNRTYLNSDGQKRQIAEVELRNIIGL